MIRVYDEAGNVIGTHEHKDDFTKSNPPRIRKSPFPVPETRSAFHQRFLQAPVMRQFLRATL
jgi:hypothetical protein